MIGFHWYDAVSLTLVIVPIVVGFAWMLPDANRHGQPGWLWAVLTIPFSWVAVIVYVIVRAALYPRR